MTRDHTTLATVGEALFGPLWQTPISQALDVSDRTVRRWAAGDTPVPDGVWSDIAGLCAARGKSLSKWAEKLKS